MPGSSGGDQGAEAGIDLGGGVATVGALLVVSSRPERTSMKVNPRRDRRRAQQAAWSDA